MSDVTDLAPVVKDTLELVSGTSVGQAASDLLADKLQVRRFRNQLAALVDARRQIDEAGLTGQVVPAKTLVPLLEFVGLEDEHDEDMIGRWASLLANAATPQTPHVARSFVDVLGVLEPIEAQWIDALFRGHDVFVQAKDDAEWTALWVRFSNLERLGLIDFEGSGPGLQIAAPGEIEADWSRRLRYLLTPYGRAFGAAVQPPAAVAQADPIPDYRR